jgi:hypothetical protein
MWPPNGETALLPRREMERAYAANTEVAAGSENYDHAVFSGQRQRSLIRHIPQRGLRARQV